VDRPDATNLIRTAKEVAAAISFDMNGAMIGGQYMGGNGGLISIATLKKVDELRRAISAIEGEAR